MWGYSRKPNDRTNPGRRACLSPLEALEGRQLLSSVAANLANGGTIVRHFYRPTILQQPTLVTPSQSQSTSVPITFQHPFGSNPAILPLLDNDGKVLTGKDRQGDEWQITVHGPGAAIVTDVTPNDGSLDDDIDTIQLVGTNPNTTFVTGQVTSSARTLTDGTVFFNHLVSETGVNSIILNGFSLSRTATKAPTTPNVALSDIYLPGGVRYLSFHEIVAPFDLALAQTPITIQIGSSTDPLRFKPSIKIDSVFNTVFDSTQAVQPNGTPQTNPSVQILVNGQLHSLDMLSTTQAVIPGGQTVQFPVVGTTGRTAVRALGIDNLKVAGSATNFTASRAAVPFQNGFSGLNHLNRAAFGGVTDAVGLDVNGKIGGLKFARGLGNPAGSSIAATSFGLPDAQRGYPSFGLLGGQVTATQIGHIGIGPANAVLQTAQDPDFIQLQRQGSTTFFTRPGNALTTAAIVSSGSIGKTTIVGTSLASEIKSGFDNTSFVAGLEGTRAKSSIKPFNQKGDLVDSVVSATYRPTRGNNEGVYGQTGVIGQLTDTQGPGTIKGKLTGSLFTQGSQTALHNRGAGVFARIKVGNLPPPETPKRVNGVLVRV